MGGRQGRLAGVGIAIAVGVAPFGASAQTAPTTPAAPSWARCEQLMTFYDQRQGQWPGATARTNRQFGELDCRKGDHAKGVKQLETAIRAFGGIVPD